MGRGAPQATHGRVGLQQLLMDGRWRRGSDILHGRRDLAPAAPPLHWGKPGGWHLCSRKDAWEAGVKAAATA